MNLLWLVALVAFIIAAIVAFITDTDVRDILGIISIGLAAWAAGGVWPNPRP